MTERILFVNQVFSRISGMLLFPIGLFSIIAINYILKDNFYSFGFLLVCSLGILLLYFGVQPSSVRVSEDIGYSRIEWKGMFNIMGIIFTIIILFYWFYFHGHGELTGLFVDH